MIDVYTNKKNKINNMTSERIKEIQKQTAYPNSVSVQQALLQVWNECEQDKSKIEITKQTAIDFANWLDKLSPSQKTSVWDFTCYILYKNIIRYTELT